MKKEFILIRVEKKKRINRTVDAIYDQFVVKEYFYYTDS